MRKPILIIAVSVLCSAAVTLLIVMMMKGQSSEQGKTVFMDSYEVFENFEMKKDFDIKLSRDISADQALLDSLGKALAKATDELTVNKLKKEFTERKLSFDQKYKETASRYTDEVYAKLNGLVSQYGKEKKYTIILGSNGDGNVMYVDTSNNITADLIKYINTAYLK